MYPELIFWSDCSSKVFLWVSLYLEFAYQTTFLSSLSTVFLSLILNILHLFWTVFCNFISQLYFATLFLNLYQTIFLFFPADGSLMQWLKWSWVYFAKALVHSATVSNLIRDLKFSATYNKYTRNPRTLRSGISSYPEGGILSHILESWINPWPIFVPGQTDAQNIILSKSTKTLPDTILTHILISSSGNDIFGAEYSPFSLFASKIFMVEENGINWVICQCKEELLRHKSFIRKRFSKFLCKYAA